MKNIAIFFFSLFFTLTTSSCDNKKINKDAWEWDIVNKTVVNKDLNLKWDLSDFEWIVADKEAMPDNMVFCAKCQEGVALSIIELPQDEEVTNVWKESDEFLKGLISSISSQEGIFPGIRNEDIQSEKCYFLFKKALKISVINEIKDARIDTGSLTLLETGYLFIKDKTPIVIMLMMPYNFVIEGGEEIVNYFFNSFSYINASAELKN